MRQEMVDVISLCGFGAVWLVCLYVVYIEGVEAWRIYIKHRKTSKEIKEVLSREKLRVLKKEDKQ